MAHPEIVTREGSLYDGDDFASLHAANLPNEDGLDLLKLHYRARLHQKGFVSVCALHGDQVVGFACGIDRRTQVIPTLSRYPLELAGIILRHPPLIGRILVRVLAGLRALVVAMHVDLPWYECGPVVVKNQYRNIRVGSALMRALNQAMEARRIPAAFLRVSSGNEAARRLYERSGYVPLRREGGSMVMVIRFSQPFAGPVPPS